MFLQGDAERMTTLITEDKARFEAKYQSPEVLPSFHNFVVLSNNEKAVQVPNEERRFFMLRAQRKQYSQGQWSTMWAQVKDPDYQALFWNYLMTVDTSRIIKGQAPKTSYKTSIQARQAPEAIKFCKALLDDPKLMVRPMADLSTENEQMQLREEFDSRGRFALQSRPNAAAARVFSNLVEEDSWETAQLKEDLKRNSGLKCLVPYRHVISCIMMHFKGEAYSRIVSDDVMTALKELGISPRGNARIPIGGTSRRCFIFPSVQGLRYLLKKQSWLTEDDQDFDEEEED